MDFLSDMFDTVVEAINDTLGSTIEQILENTIYKWMYYLIIGLCKVVGYLDSFYKVFSGQAKVNYDGSHTFLINVFFENHTVNNVYWGFAMIGITLAFALGIMAVTRKMFDMRDKDQRSMGQILGSLGKSLLLIVSMNFIILVVISFSNVLLQQISYVFDYAEILDQDKEPKVFTEEQYAAMGRVLNTIGNYSLSDTYASTYNINSCFNEIRLDLNYLTKQGVFDYYYETKNDKGEIVDTWQSLLQDIARASNLDRDIKMDIYYEEVSNSIQKCMKAIRTNSNLKPLSRYERNYKISVSDGVPLDRYVFLIGTFSAAKNSLFNQNPELTDAIRGPYYFGDKDIYDFSDVRVDFSFAFDSYNYLIVILVIVILIWNIGVIVFGCISRIFMMLLLYVVSPLVFATEPWDDGEKRKQWSIAFIVQTFGVLGTIIAMRVMMIFIPIVLSSKFVIFDNVVSNFIAKTLLIVGGYLVSQKASGVITGILANSAGMQSINSGDASAAGSALLSAPFKVIGGAFTAGKWLHDKMSGGGSGSSGGGGGAAGGGGAESAAAGGGGGSIASQVMQPLPESNHDAGGSGSSGGGDAGGGGAPDLPSSNSAPAGGGEAGGEE